jgi:hypothetical protein
MNMTASTNIDIALVQIKILETMIQCEDFQKRHPRYPAGTIVNGVNVGGQFMPKDGGGGSASQNPLSEMPAKLIDKLKNLPPTGFIDIEGVKPSLKGRLELVRQGISENVSNTSITDSARSTIAAVINKENLINWGKGFGNFIKEDIPGILKSISAEMQTKDPAGVMLGMGAVVACAFSLGGAIGAAAAASAGFGIPAILFNALLAGGRFATPALFSVAAIHAGVKIAQGTGKYFQDKKTKAQLKEIEDLLNKWAIEKTEEVAGGLDDSFEKESSIPIADVHKTLERLYLKKDSTFSDPFTKRLKELNSLVGKQRTKEEDVKFKWLRGIVESEVKYGESIDSFLVANEFGKDDSIDDKNYGKFIDSISKETQNLSASILPKKALLDRAFAKIAFGGSLYLIEDLKKMAQKGDPEATKQLHRIEGAIEIIKDIDKITDGPPTRISLTTVRVENPTVADYGAALEDGRGMHYIPAELNPILKNNSDALISIGHYDVLVPFGGGVEAKDRSIVFHEVGHAIEIQAGIGEQSASYIMDRASEQTQKDVPINTLQPKERVPNGGFSTGPYTGRIYTLVGGTELVSMGLQQLAHPITAKALAMHDREHLLYTLYALEAHD